MAQANHFKPLSLWAPNPSTGERGMSAKLSSDKKGSLVYASGRSVFIKNIDSLHSTAYTGHVQSTTVAKFSPSGNYVASGDVTGAVRVWDVAGEDQVLKVEVKAIAGRINDLAWDSENGGKRIIAVGEGRERYGHAFAIDGGNSVGEIAGHSRTVRAVAMRSTRPFRAVTASDDTTLAFFHGTPYKYNKTIRTHTKFVQAVEYSLDDKLFASAGSDAKCFLYDGSTGEQVGELGEKEGHSGTIFSIGWSGLNSSTLASFSADGTVRLWDAEKQRLVTTWTLASSPSPEQQQVGGTWLEGHRFCSLAYNGDLTILDERESKTVKIIYGPQKGIISAAKLASGIYAGDHSGRMLVYSDDGSCKLVDGKPNSNIIALSASKSKVYSIGLDDQVRSIDPKTATYSPSDIVPLPEQPKAIATRPGTDELALVVTENQARLVSAGNTQLTIPLDYSATACAITAKYAAIGSTDGKVYIYTYSAPNALTHTKTLEVQNSGISAMASNEHFLASADTTGKIVVIELVDGFPVKIMSHWCWHSAKVLSLEWRENFLVSGGLDTHVFVWNVEKPMKRIAIKNAHVGGTTMVGWDGEKKIVSCGSDGVVRRYEVDLEKLK
ncbi:hypothetical protein CROQUDRAFT_662591 [Cronartium quercuum f. sp. fusiforme G11]|uniref:WD40 repeat-like protein n=1 Tax=Cronartium quercuum f. sp. fusiforme G11 TaxID=708437 RepID=A0A9P6NAL7_9BASI|nr:hypothetical protein CROQUDRAFT_662591 [Cronartium quercuum f. sp. fusiforme G11]